MVQNFDQNLSIFAVIPHQNLAALVGNQGGDMLNRRITTNTAGVDATSHQKHSVKLAAGQLLSQTRNGSFEILI